MNRLKKHNLQKIPVAGDKVKWSYLHWLNSKSSVRRTKTGVFLRNIKTTKVDGGMRRDTAEYCHVHFEGNKNYSRVLISEVTKCDT